MPLVNWMHQKEQNGWHSILGAGSLGIILYKENSKKVAANVLIRLDIPGWLVATLHLVKDTAADGRKRRPSCANV